MSADPPPLPPLLVASGRYNTLDFYNPLSLELSHRVEAPHKPPARLWDLALLRCPVSARECPSGEHVVDFTRGEEHSFSNYSRARPRRFLRGERGEQALSRPSLPGDDDHAPVGGVERVLCASNYRRPRSFGIFVVSMDTMEPLCDLLGHTGEPRGICVLRNYGGVGGSALTARTPLVASGGRDGQVRIWDIASRRSVAVFWACANPDKMDPARRSVAARLNGVVDVAALGGPSEGLDDGSEARIVVAGGQGDCSLRLFDLEASCCSGVLAGHTKSVKAVMTQHLPSSSSLGVLSCARDRIVLGWDMRVDTPVARVPVKRVPFCLRAFPGDTNRILVGAGREVHVFDLRWISCGIADAPPSALLSVRDYHGPKHSLCVRQIVTLPGESCGRSKVHCCASCGDRKIVLWEAESGKTLRKLEVGVPTKGMVYLPADGKANPLGVRGAVPTDDAGGKGPPDRKVVLFRKNRVKRRRRSRRGADKLVKLMPDPRCDILKHFMRHAQLSQRLSSVEGALNDLEKTNMGKE